MAFVFPMPEIGEGVVEGEVVEWKVAIGDAVSIDQPLCDVMTDKANVEISSPKAGVITKLYGEPGDIIGVHTPLVEIDESGAAPAPLAAAPQAAAPAPQAAAPAPAPKAAAPAPKAPAPQAAAPTPASIPATRGATKAAPAVRRHAREAAVDIHDVPGTGPGGRITHDDIRAFSSAPPEPKRMPAMPQVTPSGAEERIKIVGLRRKIAEQMARSKSTAAHFTYVEEIDAERIWDVRKRLKSKAADRGVKLTFMAFWMKACSISFRTFPNINALMDEERFELVVKGDHNIGFACDTPQGLYVPVVKNVEQKSILQIAAEIDDLSTRTQAGKARIEELTGSTFTITGVGNMGVLATPVINVPEVAILAVNAIRQQAVVVDGKVEVRRRFFASPSFDHRVIDGAVAARWVDHWRSLVEDPESLLLELS